MRFAPSSAQRILPRSIIPTCPSRWRLHALPRTTALCQLRFTAHVSASNNKHDVPVGILMGVQKDKNQPAPTSKKGNSQTLLGKQEGSRPAAPTAGKQKGGQAHMEGGKKETGQAKSMGKTKKSGQASSAGTKRNSQGSVAMKQGSKTSQKSGNLPKRQKRPASFEPRPRQSNRRQPRARNKGRQLSLIEYKKLEESRRDVYNFCARFLAIPEYVITEQDTCKVRISLAEQNIQAEAEDNVKSLWWTELQACLNFKEAVERNVQQIQLPPADSFFLDASNAEEFLRYYARYKRCAHFVEQVEGNGKIYRAQVYCADVPVGVAVTGRSKKESVPLAFLTAAVQSAQKEPDVLHKFHHADRGNDGEILHSLRPVDFNIVPEMLNDMERSSRSFLQSASPITNRASVSERSWSNAFRPQRISPEDASSRNVQLLQRFEAFLKDPHLEKLRNLKDSLPMNQRREEVLKLVNNNIFSIVVGATGSGKTTQVPQIILEDAIRRNRAAEVDIICTQPRRIAAKSVATRVASERNESLQDTVGYHVKGLNRTSRQPGRMTYCTTGILLKQLQNDPDHVMDTASHIIIDEVHERDLLIDFLMITLKKVIEARQRAKKRVPNVILMSATMDTELFANYFQQKGSDGQLTPCPSISVPGRTFPVTEKFLETILVELKQAYAKSDLAIIEDKNTREYLNDEAAAREISASLANWEAGPSNIATEMKDANIPVNLVAATIAHVARTTSEGAILAFLPGLQEILETEKLLLQNLLGVEFSDTSRFRIFKLHSNLKDNQDDIFDPVPDGCRKIIISTNIAETSVTIPDVQHVIDSGKLREKRYNQLTQITKMQCVWVSKSNMRQRAGRAGRVQNGNYYALYSSSRYNSLETIGRPEMLRADLMEVCLDVKAHSNDNIGEFLAGAIQPPNPVAVDASVEDLKDIEALTDAEDLTPLGKLLARLPVHPSLGKMIVLGVIFRCLDPLLILGAAANERSLFARPLGSEKLADEEKSKFGSSTFSDPLTTINAFREARHSLNTSEWSSNRIPRFFQEKFLHYGAFMAINRTMLEVETMLEDVGVIPKTSSGNRSAPHQCGYISLNRNSNNASLIRALILAGHRGNLAVNSKQDNGSVVFSTQKEHRAMIFFGSLNRFIGNKRIPGALQKSRMLPNPSLLSFGSRSLNDQNQIILRETSLVSPLIATLFGGELKMNGNIITVGDRLQFFIRSQGTSRQASGALKQFRFGLDAMLSHALDDLAAQKTLADDPKRDQFASAVAHIIDQDFKVYLNSAASTPASSNRKFGLNGSSSDDRRSSGGRDDERRREVAQTGGHRLNLSR